MKSNRFTLLATAVTLALPAFATAAEGGAGLPPALNEGLITAIVSLVIFVVLLTILSKTAWGPIATGLAAREAKIRQDIETAERARREGEAALANYKKQIADADAQVREKLASAQKDAEAIAARLKADAEKDISEAKNRANREIEESKNAALAEVRAQAASLSTAVASKILKRNINEADQADLIRSSLEELQSAARR
jgi:F-type H+-transporting ATPase subunit b